MPLCVWLLTRSGTVVAPDIPLVHQLLHAAGTGLFKPNDERQINVPALDLCFILVHAEEIIEVFLDLFKLPFGFLLLLHLRQRVKVTEPGGVPLFADVVLFVGTEAGDIVRCSSLFITKRCIGLINLTELVLCILTLVHIRMVLFRKNQKATLDLVLRSIFRNTEYF